MEHNPSTPAPAGVADADALAAALADLAAESARVAHLAGRLVARAPAAPIAPYGAPPAPQLLTLDQLAALAHRSKRTLEKYRSRMPAPRVEGGGGRPHLYDWAEARPWLARTFGVDLPEEIPGHRP